MPSSPVSFDVLDWAVADASKTGSATAPKPPAPDELCACGVFGPWGDGSAFYCREHVPPQIRYAAQFFAETMGE